MGKEEEAIRLYSKPVRAPVDNVEEKHQDIHADLQRWGAWNSERYRANSCYSVESRYREQTPTATGKPVDPKMIAIERAVLALPADHRDTVRMFYVQRMTPHRICKQFTLRWTGFPAWMFACRAMVLNILRRNGS